MSISLIPESAPFDAEQRAWLNGFFAGLLGMNDANGNGNGTASILAGSNGALLPGNSVAALLAPANVAAPQADEDEDFPWHDPALPLDERLQLAQEKPVKRQLMAAMAQLDCGACGYLCKTYSEAIADGREKSLTLCSPGGKETAKILKKILKEQNGSQNGVGHNGNGVAAAAAPSTAHQANGYDRKNPFPAGLISSANLNKQNSAKHTSHVVLDLNGSGLRYSVGDSLGVYPTNCPDLVCEIIDALKASGDEPVTTAEGQETTLRDALTKHCNLRDIDEQLVLLLTEAAGPAESERLKALAANDDQLAEFDLLDLLQQYPAARPDVRQLVTALPALAPRLYSIASSLKAHPDQVHLTVAKATALIGSRLRKGVASTMLAERVGAGDKLHVFVQPTHGFTLPDDASCPIIMVGPGTGVAPFRAFLQERKATAATGPSWLFFGDQHRATDFLYEEEFNAYLQDGTLTRLDIAFSRDQEQKIYVQDRMRAAGAELFDWLQRGAYFYVCGDAKRMAGDVDLALHDIVAQHGNLSSDAAKAYIAQLSKQKRYRRDVY